LVVAALHACNWISGSADARFSVVGLLSYSYLLVFLVEPDCKRSEEYFSKPDCRVLFKIEGDKEIAVLSLFVVSYIVGHVQCIVHIV